jgi:hypothetical protein
MLGNETYSRYTLTEIAENSGRETETCKDSKQI